MCNWIINDYYEYDSLIGAFTDIIKIGLKIQIT